MTKFSDLVTYFENISRLHKSIAHSESQKHFFRFEIDEVLSGLNRTDSEYPMLILEGYHYDFTDNGSDNILKNRRGAFILLQKITDITNHDEIHQAWDDLEQIGDHILARIKTDKYNQFTPVVRDFQFSSVDARTILNEIGNDAGIRYSFTLTSPAPADVDQSRWYSTESE